MESGKISLKKTEFSPETGGDSVFVAFIRAYIRTVCREKPSAKKNFLSAGAKDAGDSGGF